VFRSVLRALLFLPGAVYCSGARAALHAWRKDPGFTERLLGAHHELRACTLAWPRAARWFLFAAFSAGYRVHAAGSVRRALERAWRVMRSRGSRGLADALRSTSPGGAGIDARIDADVSVVLDPGSPEARARARRVLVLDHRIPRGDSSAGELATIGIVRDLAAIGFEVAFMPHDVVPGASRHEAVLRDLGVEVVTRESGFGCTRHFIERCGAEFGFFYIVRFDVAESALRTIRAVAPTARVILHAPDLYFLREMREAKLGRDPAALARAEETRRREVAVMRQCDHVVVVSAAEVPHLREQAGFDTPVSVFPVLYAPVAAQVVPYDQRRDIFFLGGFGHRPNVSAVEWFAHEVWPAIRQALPEAGFHIIGADVPESVKALERFPGVKVVGFVPELDPVLSGLRVGVAPLLYGAGIKGKVAMTLGAGIPCVCTEIAAEGMGIESGVHALVASDAAKFAAAVVALYNDEALWSRLSVGGQDLVRRRFGETANRGALLRVLNEARVLPIALWREHCERLEAFAVPAPPTDAVVDVSVIVPAFNKWTLTRTCIASVVAASAGAEVRFEVIIADDCSTDETASAGERLPGVRMARTPANVGFLRNCNHAARHARGAYIVLLNNDTVVLPGWLEALHATMERDDAIAIAGSKLLYADGTIQEAGGGLLDNAEGVSIGRALLQAGELKPARRDEPVFNFERETDYLTGASIMVRASFWRQVGGFDESFDTAYCEDADLAMQARVHGLRVVYQPRSEVVHLEHQSYSGEADGGHADLQRRNKALLQEKWQTVLARDHLPEGSGWPQVAAHGERAIPPVMLARRRHSDALRILYFSPFPSHPSNHGNQATIQQFARQFRALGHKVHFAVLKSGLFDAAAERAMQDAWDTLDVLPNTLALGADGSPIPFDGWYEQGLGERIRALCARYEADVLLCSYVFQSKMLEYIPHYILKVIDTHDKMGNRYEMLRAKGLPLEFFSCTPDEEGTYLRRADVVVARRQEEADYFNSVTGTGSAVVVPHFEAPHFVERRFAALERVSIVASANRINLIIVRDFLHAVERHLQGRRCPFIVTVAGQVRDMVASLPVQERKVFGSSWVRLPGFVEDLDRFYAETDLVVSPVTIGTGINVKTVQAMAYGMPLLTTAWGSKGIDTSEPLHRLPDLDALVEAMFQLAAAPGDLERLQVCSCDAYQRFFDASVAALGKVLERVPREDRPRQ
jgi:GT2 family glycosyltransferase/glycosyltransferase involved in cell wall biosynthesis